MSEKAIAGNKDSLQILFEKILYFWLCHLLLTVCSFSLLAAIGGYSLLSVLRLLIAEASPVKEQGL